MALIRAALGQESYSSPLSEQVLDGLCRFDIRNSRRALAQFRAAAPLPTELQTVFDDAVIGVGRQGLVLVNDLISAGLTRDLPGWLGITTIGHYRRSGDVGMAQRTMELDVRGERQVHDRDKVILPVFATHDDFSFGPRELAEAARLGTPLPTDGLEQATRNVNVAIEDQAINGWTDANGTLVNVAGNPVPGLLSSPANTFVYTGTNKAWDHASKTGQEIIADVMGMLAMANADYFYGPKFNFYMPTSYWNRVQDDYIVGNVVNGTILSRLQKIGGEDSQTITFRHLPYMPANRTALVQMTSDVIDVVIGQTPAELSWTANNGLGRRFFLVLASMFVRIKADYNSGAGIVIGNTV